MATATFAVPHKPADYMQNAPESRFLLRDIPWDVYEALRNEDANRHVHMTYLDGDLELMTVSWAHERYSVWLGLFVLQIACELRIPIVSGRCTTWKRKGRGYRKGRGKEADDCFYIASRDRVRGRRSIDLKVDPPPDLAIEVELSESDLDIMQVYGALRVPEVWRFDGESFRVCIRRPDGTYKESERSPSLPFLRPDEVVRWLERAAELDDDAQFIEEVRAWAREVIVPRHNV